jgi:hypothetical protein
MQLPGRLSGSSLTTVLGVLHAARTTGVLEVSRGASEVHRIAFVDGLVCAVEAAGPTPSLADVLRRMNACAEDSLRKSLHRALAERRRHGEVLVEERRVSPTMVQVALRRQLLERLNALKALPDANLRFRVATKPTLTLSTLTGLAPEDYMGPEELRSALGYKETPVDAQITPPAPRVEEIPAARSAGADPVRREAYATLGLRVGADAGDVKRAYRRLVRELHPDTNPQATLHERTHLSERFQRVTAAYRTLVA